MRAMAILMSLLAVPALTLAASGAYLDFDGTSDRVTIPDAGHLDPAQITIEAWVNFDRLASGSGYSGSDSQFLIGKGSDLAPTYYLAQGGPLGQDAVTFATNWGVGAVGYPSLETGQWYHVAGSYDGSTLRVFFNGTEIGSKAATGQSLANAKPLYLSFNTDSWSYYLDGKLDEIIVWDHARTEVEIQSDMNGLTGLEDGLLGYWTFEEPADSQTVIDHSPYANHGYLGKTTGVDTSDPARVPEPATLGLLALGGLAVLRRRRGGSDNRSTRDVAGQLNDRTSRYRSILRAVIISVGGGLWLLSGAAASAETMRFTHAGSGAGTLNGVPFPTADFVITSVAESDDRRYVSGVYSLDHASSSISIEGLGDFAILTGTRTFWDPGAWRVGYSRAGIDGLDLLLGPENAAFASWDMASPIGPVTGPTWGLEQWTREPLIETTGGVLIFNDGGGDATFTAVVIPEPATLGLLAFGGLAVLRRGRR